MELIQAVNIWGTFCAVWTNWSRHWRPLVSWPSMKKWTVVVRGHQLNVLTSSSTGFIFTWHICKFHLFFVDILDSYTMFFQHDIQRGVFYVVQRACAPAHCIDSIDDGRVIRAWRQGFGQSRIFERDSGQESGFNHHNLSSSSFTHATLDGPSCKAKHSLTCKLHLICKSPCSTFLISSLSCSLQWLSIGILHSLRPRHRQRCLR